MKHARSDYDRIQDPEGLIPENEPVFLLRGKDILSPAFVDMYAEMYAAQYPGDDDAKEVAARLKKHAQKMRAWQRDVEGQTPTVPVKTMSGE